MCSVAPGGISVSSDSRTKFPWQKKPRHALCLMRLLKPTTRQEEEEEKKGGEGGTPQVKINKLNPFTAPVRYPKMDLKLSVTRSGKIVGLSVVAVTG